MIDRHVIAKPLHQAADLDRIVGRFTHSADGLGLVAARVKAAERGVRILCDNLVILGFLTKAENRYGLTDESALFLDRKSPACIASARCLARVQSAVPRRTKRAVARPLCALQRRRVLYLLTSGPVPLGVPRESRWID